MMTGIIGLAVMGVAVAIAAFGGAAWGHWASRRYTDQQIDWERDARQRQNDSLQKLLAQRIEQHVEDTDSRIDTVEDAAVVQLQDQTKRLTNATAMAKRVQRGRDRLRDENADLKARLKKRTQPDAAMAS